MVKYTSIKKTDGENRGHSEDLKKEMMHWGLTSTEFQDLKATKQWTKCVVALLVNNEIERVSKLPKASKNDIEQANKAFLPLSGATFEAVSTKPAPKTKAPQPKKRTPLKPLKPLFDNGPKKKAARRNRS
jgi:hypothetical protein